jgi:hypothetical protein
VRVTVVARTAGDDGDIRLRLGTIVDGQRQLSAHIEAGPECAAQRVLDQSHGRAVQTLLGRHVQNLPIDELEARIGLQTARGDQPLELATGPQMRLVGNSGHFDITTLKGPDTEIASVLPGCQLAASRNRDSSRPVADVCCPNQS